MSDLAAPSATTGDVATTFDPHKRIKELEWQVEQLTLKADFAAENAVADFFRGPVLIEGCHPDEMPIEGVDPSVPFARIVAWKESGDASVGIDGSGGLALDTDQTGTQLATILANLRQVVD